MNKKEQKLNYPNNFQCISPNTKFNQNLASSNFIINNFHAERGTY